MSATFSEVSFGSLGRASQRITRGLALVGEAERMLRALEDSGAPTFAAQGQALRHVSKAMLALHRLEVTVSGRIPARPMVIVANHVSYLDPLVVASVVPVLPIAKHELSTWPILGAAARRLGVCFVERASINSRASALRRTFRVLRAGGSVLNFPEGTTTNGQLTLPFQRGIFGMARKARVPILPARIDFEDPRATWVGDSAFLPHYLWLAGQPATRAHLRFGAPIFPHPVLKAEELAQWARTTIEGLRT